MLSNHLQKLLSKSLLPAQRAYFGVEPLFSEAFGEQKPEV